MNGFESAVMFFAKGFGVMHGILELGARNAGLI